MQAWHEHVYCNIIRAMLDMFIMTIYWDYRNMHTQEGYAAESRSPAIVQLCISVKEPFTIHGNLLRRLQVKVDRDK